MKRIAFFLILVKLKKANPQLNGLGESTERH